MTESERERFDGLLDEVVGELPENVRLVLQQLPLVVIDRPTEEMLRDLGMAGASEEEILELCGLHSGVANTERSVEDHAVMPSEIHLFREGLVELSGGWDDPDIEDELYEQILITLLHEIGHQMGLGEDELRDLGYD